MIEQLLAAIRDLTRRVGRLETQGGAGRWVDWTPTVTQGVGVAVTVAEAKYCIMGKVCHINALLAVTSGGTSGGHIIIGSIPLAAQPAMPPSGNSPPFGNGHVSSGGTNYLGMVYASAATQFRMWDPGTRAIVGSNPAFALANGNTINFTAAYRVA